MQDPSSSSNNHPSPQPSPNHQHHTNHMNSKNRNSFSSTHFVQSSHINYNYNPPPSIYLDSPPNSNSNDNSTNLENDSTSPPATEPLQSLPSSSSNSSSSSSSAPDHMNSTAGYKYNGFESDSSTSAASDDADETTHFEQAQSCNNYCECDCNCHHHSSNNKSRAITNVHVHEKPFSKKKEKKNQFPPELQASIHLALFHLHFVCGICNEVIIDCVCLQCGHNFCTHCLNQWFEYNRTCPTCFYPVDEKFKTQRIYCVDEFLSELYQPVQELCAALFGKSSMPPVEPLGPGLKRTMSDIQVSLGNARIVNNTKVEERLKLKKLRREHALQHNFQSSESPEEYSILEQQTELFGGLYSVNLTSVVQFFLSFVTAYIFYEGGDSVDNDYILLVLVSVLVWFAVFMGVMRIMGYEGTFTQLMLQLNFIEFVRLNEGEGVGIGGTERFVDAEGNILENYQPVDDNSSDSNQDEDENGNQDETDTDENESTSGSGDTETDTEESMSSAQSIISMIHALPNYNATITDTELEDDEDSENLFYPAPSSTPNTEVEDDDSSSVEEDFDDWETMDEFSGSGSGSET